MGTEAQEYVGEAAERLCLPARVLELFSGGEPEGVGIEAHEYAGETGEYLGENSSSDSIILGGDPPC